MDTGSSWQLNGHFAAGRILLHDTLVSNHFGLQDRSYRDVPDSVADVLLWVGIEIRCSKPAQCRGVAVTESARVSPVEEILLQFNLLSSDINRGEVKVAIKVAHCLYFDNQG